MPVLLSDVASVRRGPAIRRGVAELNGQGEVAGGIIIMRSGKNALSTINAVKAKLAEVQKKPARRRGDCSGLRSFAAD
ncbi:Cobalt-zinc-cadmium resistance protein CzcA, Cation efflux system protein CusA [Klebsiella michiganensis]|uniref:Cobalt-zinc-cadmium resistance protein CzcA, Cation efflux system protein CusA n=1 Tax=Klebsiella michiganensis TaxID=1134687 RepID=A0A7H4MYU1_9ENTR|nr:Cobalt-zinc-cadmium resistance protein CzcA, Cation efflux system protein CusA [Klebsiella michiganensis]